MYKQFDVIVVGAGHAGIEACLAAARLGQNTLMITSNVDRIGYMSCNPSIGGLAKGHMVREIDVMGGQMGIVSDKTCIQFKRLNSRKGPAVRGTRMQSDKFLYNKIMRNILHNTPGLTVIQNEVKSLVLDAGTCIGVLLADGSKVLAKSTIITTGTFMNGVMHVGLEQISGGRVGDKATIGLSDQLKEFGFLVQRLKTGTPARLDKDTIDFSKTIPQLGDPDFFPFSFRSSKKPELQQVACYLSRTTHETHDIIRKNLDKSPMYCGIIEGVGPRYCPSIEDKVVRFGDREGHQTFLEPEGLNTNWMYLQGISTSLPIDIQDQFLRTIPGLENVKILQYGYAVEYDYIEPTQIYHSLETRPIKNLFLAGQINGTSGYEEAAAQGFIAGVNASRKNLDVDALILGRHESYIGVLIDDLVTKGTKEPYRMFTSRAEHRLVLREDNTIDRLASVSSDIGILKPSELELFSELSERRKQLHAKLSSEKVFPNQATQDKLKEKGTSVLLKSITFNELLRRSEISSLDLPFFDFDLDSDPQVYEPVEIEVKYSGYIKRQQELVDQTRRLESFSIAQDVDFSLVKGLSNEEIEKLNRIRPTTIGQAQRISGVNPSAIQAIIIYLKGNKKIKEMNLEQH